MSRRNHRPLHIQPGLTAALAAGSMPVQVRESTATQQHIRETTAAAIQAAPAGDGAGLVVDMHVIEAGWNSSQSRYYPADMLARDVPKVFGAGTHMHIDHPSATEEVDRPERSLSTLAAVFTEDPYTTDGGQTMRVKARVFAPYRQFITEAWQHIGVSINGGGVGEYAERDGHTGLVINELTFGESVDFVTKPGAGGRILSLLESARKTAAVREARSVGVWLESRLHLALTAFADEMYGDGRLTREERITLSSAIGDGLVAWTARVEADAPQLFQRDLWDEPDVPVATAEAGQARIGYAPTIQPTDPRVPGIPALREAITTDDVTDGTPPTGSPNPTKEEPDMSGTQTGGTPPAQAGTAPVVDTPPSVSHEARAVIAESHVREAQARITTLESANASLIAERDAARIEMQRVRNLESARGVVSGALAGVEDLPATARQRVIEAATRDVPTVADGTVDATALTAAVTRAVEAERAYIAAIRQDAGVGTPTGLAGQPQGANVREAAGDPGAWHDTLAGRFARLGMDDASAKLAAGRVS